MIQEEWRAKWCDEKEDVRVVGQQVDVLYQQSPVALLANLAAAVILVSVFWNAAPRPLLLGWSLCLVLVTLGGLMLVHRYRAAAPRPGEVATWLRLYIAGSGLSGVIWGATVILLVPEASAAHAGFAVLWVCGLSAGSVAALSVVKPAFFAFSIPALLPGALSLVTQWDSLIAMVGGGQLMFLGFISLSALRMNTTLVRALVLQIENLQLVDDLDREKREIERLNTDLEGRVIQRTTELETANTRLERDIDRRQQVERALHAERERAVVTLHSIGDGVISTDASGLIEYLNPVAELLTEWPVMEARGQPLHDVFRVIDETTGEPIADPVTRYLDERSTLGLGAQSVLVSRHGRRHPIQDSAAPINNADGTVSGMVLVFRDSTELDFLARHDALTGLLSRWEFERHLTDAFARCRRYQRSLALVYIDLDRFKEVNDALGHFAGDSVLKVAGARIAATTRETDKAARPGGDEFLVLLEDVPGEMAVKLRAERLLESLSQPVDIAGRHIVLSASAGVALYPADADDPDGLTRAGDRAMYASKKTRGNAVRLYSTLAVES